MTPRPRSAESRFEPSGKDGIERMRSSGNYWLRDTIYQDGDMSKPVKIDRSLKTKNLSEAVERATRIRAKITKGEKLERKQVRHLMSAAFDLLDKLQSTKAPKTYTSFKTQEKHLRPFLCGQVECLAKGLPEYKARCPYLDDFERDFESVWADYLLDSRERRPGVKCEHDRATLVQVLKRARNKGWIQRHFTKADFELNEASEPIGQFIEDEEVQALLAALVTMVLKREAYQAARRQKLGADYEEPPYWFPEKDYLQVLIAVTMGMRKSEILHLHRDEIDMRKREINPWARRIKTRKKRVTPIPISDDVYPVLKRALEAAPGPFVFPKMRGHLPDPNEPQDDNSYAWDEIREETGIEVRFHDLRHTAITNLLDAGFPESDIRNMLGVSDETLRRIYAHLKQKTKDRFRSAFAGRFTGGKSNESENPKPAVPEDAKEESQ